MKKGKNYYQIGLNVIEDNAPRVVWKNCLTIWT